MVPISDWSSWDLQYIETRRGLGRTPSASEKKFFLSIYTKEGITPPYSGGSRYAAVKGRQFVLNCLRMMIEKKKHFELNGSTKKNKKKRLDFYTLSLWFYFK